MLVIGPAAKLYCCIVKTVEHTGGNGSTLCYQVGTQIVLHALALLILGEFDKLIHENSLQVLHLIVELLIDSCQTGLILLLGSTGLHSL